MLSEKFQRPRCELPCVTSLGLARPTAAAGLGTAAFIVGPFREALKVPVRPKQLVEG